MDIFSYVHKSVELLFQILGLVEGSMDVSNTVGTPGCWGPTLGILLSWYKLDDILARYKLQILAGHVVQCICLWNFIGRNIIPPETYALSKGNINICSVRKYCRKSTGIHGWQRTEAPGNDQKKPAKLQQQQQQKQKQWCTTAASGKSCNCNSSSNRRSDTNSNNSCSTGIIEVASAGSAIIAAVPAETKAEM